MEKLQKFSSSLIIFLTKLFIKNDFFSIYVYEIILHGPIDFVWKEKKDIRTIESCDLVFWRWIQHRLGLGAIVMFFFCLFLEKAWVIVFSINWMIDSRFF